MFHKCCQIFVSMSQNTEFLFCFSSVSWVWPWPACLLNLTIPSHLLITWPPDRSYSDVLYCGCFNMFCNVRLCVCVGFVMCGCCDNCVGVLVIPECWEVLSPTRKETRLEACQGRARFQQHRDASCQVFFFPSRQGAEENSRHSYRNISLFPSWSG